MSRSSDPPSTRAGGQDDVSSKQIPSNQKIGKSRTSDFDNFGLWKSCFWISRLCGIGRRLRRLQRPGVVSFKAIVKHIKRQISENREIGLYKVPRGSFMKQNRKRNKNRNCFWRFKFFRIFNRRFNL